MCDDRNELNNDIPNNAVEILFAEEFVNNSLNRLMSPCLPSRVEDYRTKIHNAFNPKVRVAANILSKQLEKEMEKEFENILSDGQLHRNSFINYVEKIKVEYRLGCLEDFHPEKLLHFCVRTAWMAWKFCREGFDEGPALAVQHIVRILEDYNMTPRGWQELNVLAENYYAMIRGDKTADSMNVFDSSNCSKADLMTTAIQGVADKVKHCFKEWRFSALSSDSEASEVEYSDESSSETMSVDETIVIGFENTRVVTGRPLENANSNDVEHLINAFRADCGIQKSSDNESTASAQRGSGSSKSVYVGDTECDSDVFKDSVDGVTPVDEFGRRPARKRRASSSSCSSGFYMPASVEQVDEHKPSLSPSDSACRENPNVSPSEPGCNAENSAVISPVRKKIAKNRKSV